MSDRRSRWGALAVVLACLTLPAATALVEALSFYAGNRSTGFIQVEDRTRGYVLHVPRELDRARPVPLVISLHGAGLWGAAQRDISRCSGCASKSCRPRTSRV